MVARESLVWRDGGWPCAREWHSFGEVCLFDLFVLFDLVCLFDLVLFGWFCFVCLFCYSFFVFVFGFVMKMLRFGCLCSSYLLCSYVALSECMQTYLTFCDCDWEIW